MNEQLGAAIDPQSGNIVIVRGNQPLFSLTPKDAIAFAAGLCALVAEHPQLKPAEPAHRLLIAGSVPPFAGRH